MRNEHGYNSLTGCTAISDVQTMLRGRPKTPPRQPTPPRRELRSPEFYRPFAGSPGIKILGRAAAALKPKIVAPLSSAPDFSVPEAARIKMLPI